MGLIRSLESDVEDLKRQISGHEKTNQDKVAEIRASIFYIQNDQTKMQKSVELFGCCHD